MHVLRSNVFSNRQGEDRVHQEQEIRIPFWPNCLRHLVSNPLRYVSDVVHSNALTKTAT